MSSRPSFGTSRHPYEESDPHRQISVFVGPDAAHRSLAGVLHLYPGEDDEFIRRVEDRHQPPAWLRTLHDWLTTEGAAPLDFDGEEIPTRLRALLDTYFHGVDWEVSP